MLSRKDKAQFYALVGVGMFLVTLFGIAWFMPTNIPHNFSGFAHFVDILLFVVVSYIVWHQVCTEILLWMVMEKSKRQEHFPARSGYRVAFITTFVPSSEPVEILERVLPAMLKVDYPHDVWLLDEGMSKEAWSVCQRLGVKYFTRKGIEKYNTIGANFAIRTKGGNHNAWYDAFGKHYDIVAQLDPDFIPKRNFLTSTLGYFEDPNIAFVGTPQIYGNMDKSIITKGAAEQQYTFYGPILRGLAARDMTMMLGANHVVRVAALKEINFYGAHLTEDLLTGMMLHSRNWKSVYVPDVLAIGEGPETWSAYFNQQMRWAFGCIDILFNHSFKLMLSMNSVSRRYYLMLMQHYFSGLAAGLGIVLIMLSLLFGIQPAAIGLHSLVFYFPLLFWQLLITLWSQRFNALPNREKGLLLSARVLSIAAWPIYLMAFIGVVRGKRLSFKVTPKGGDQDAYVPLSVFRTHLILGAIVSFGIEISFLTHHQNPLTMFWAVLTVVSMFGIALGAWVDGLIKSRRFSKTKAPDAQYATN